MNWQKSAYTFIFLLFRLRIYSLWKTRGMGRPTQAIIDGQAQSAVRRWLGHQHIHAQCIQAPELCVQPVRMILWSAGRQGLHR